MTTKKRSGYVLDLMKSGQLTIRPATARAPKGSLAVHSTTRRGIADSLQLYFCKLSRADNATYIVNPAYRTESNGTCTLADVTALQAAFVAHEARIRARA